MPTAKKTEREKLIEKLKALKPYVTNQMKYKVAAALEINDRTIDKYLKGDVATYPIGKAIYEELQKEVPQAVKAA